MQVRVDETLCTGCEVCVDTCPEVFEMGDGVAQVKVNPVPEDIEGSCQEAADGCPCEAIIIE
ncbi:MAG: ferredoxin [Pirellulaceae bacterium]|jgi:ferredoxin|nr:ferredoxin [Pirellulaceae bacterium]